MATTAAPAVVPDAHALSAAEFEARFEAPSVPCVLQGLAREWPAARGAWSVARLCERFPAHEWDMGLESGVATTLPAFLREHRAGVAAAAAAAGAGASLAPLPSPPGILPARYIFDDTFGESLPELLHDYTIPTMFPTYERDPLSYLSALPALRPRYRWLLVGVPGSGFTIHQDPFGTSAWNTLLEGGRKRWVLLPPTTPLGLVLPSLGTGLGGGGGGGGSLSGGDTHGGDAPATPPEPLRNPNQPQEPPPYWEAPDCADGDSDAGVELPEREASAAGWFAHILPTLRERARSEYGLHGAALGLLEVEQRPGDTLFIPAGWWHVALTLSPPAAPPGEGGRTGGAPGAAAAAAAAAAPGCDDDAGLTVAVTYNYLPAVGFASALAQLAARPGSGARAAYRWCRRAADAGLPEAVRCLDLPALVAGRAQHERELAAELEGAATGSGGLQCAPVAEGGGVHAGADA